jgi:hypothetical protein
MAADKAQAPAILWADPFQRLASALESEAATLRDLGSDEERAALLESIATRVTQTITAAATAEWIRLVDAAGLLGAEQDTMRSRCRRLWKDRGQAKKIGGDWHIHTSALAAEQVRKAA